MVTVPELLAIIALVLGLYEEFNAQGRSAAGWGVILLSVALLWAVIT
jgi:drug/metabolite transporter superfamily protein YnfA